MALLATPPIPLEKRAQVEQVAAAHKVAPVTCAPIVIQWAPRSSLEADHPGLSGVAGQAFLAECRIQVSFELGTATACAILVHELGHLGGLGHSEDLNSVMAPVVAVVPEGCDFDWAAEAGRRPTRSGLFTSLRRDIIRVPAAAKSRKCRFLRAKVVYTCPDFNAYKSKKHHNWSWTWYNL